MKRAFLKTVGFILMGSFIAGGLTWVSNHFDPVHCMGKRRIKQMLRKADTIQAIAVGHSHNRSLEFREMGLDGYHLWMGGGDVFETHYLLRVVVPLLPNLKVVFMPITPHDFIHDNGASESRHAIRRAHYATMPTVRSFRPIHGDIKNLVKGKLSAIVRSDHWKGVVKSIISQLRGEVQAPYNPLCEVDEDGYEGTRITLVMDRKSLLERINKLEHHIRLAKEFYRNHPEITENVFATLVSIVKYLQEKNVRLIFYTPPYSDIYIEMLHKDDLGIVNLAKHYMQQLREDFGIEYYDFFEDPVFTGNYNYFFDVDHLNLSGARLFSQNLKRICESTKPYGLTSTYANGR